MNLLIACMYSEVFDNLLFKYNTTILMMGVLPIPVFCLTRTGLDGKEHISFDSFVACFKDNEVGMVK